jgi:protein O-mannosyl-transferase
MRGSISGQLGSGRAGKYTTGPPTSHLVVSGSPFASRGVWQSPQCATPSTIYLPRVTRPALLPALAASSLPFVSCAAVGCAPLVVDSSTKIAINKPENTVFNPLVILARRTGMVWYSFHRKDITSRAKTPWCIRISSGGGGLGVNCLPFSQREGNSGEPTIRVKSSPATKSRSRSGDRHVRKQPAKDARRVNWTLWLGFLLVAATVVLYYPVHTHLFANFDDGPYVYANQHVRAGLSWDTVKWAFASFGSVTPDVPDWHPLTWLSHALDTQVFGPDPAGPHDENLFLHVLNVVLLFWVLQRATGFTGRSAMVAALFALHPINVESVAWISERKNLLSMVFFLLALAAYRWYARKPRVCPYLVVAGFFALGLMAKPQVVTLPFVLLLWDYWPLQRMVPTSPGASLEGPPDGVLPQRSPGWLVAEKAPLFVLAAISCIITMKSQLAIGRIDKHLSLALRLGNAVVSYVRYLGKAFWPSHLALFYPHPGSSLAAWQVLAASVVLLAISGLVIVLRRRRYPVVGWLWFLGTLVPMIGLVQINHQAMADRYAYLSFIGLFILVCWGVADFGKQQDISPVWLRGASVAILLLLAAVTYRQISFWGDNMTLWSHALAVTSGNYLAEDIVGSTLMDQGYPDEALPHFLRAAEMNPSDPSAYMAIGAYDQQYGNLQQAIEQYQRAIALTDGAVQQNLWLRSTTLARVGSAYRQLGDFEQARQNFQKALAINPNQAEVWLSLGIVTQLSGDPAGAAQAYSQAIKIQPSDVGYLLLARTLEQTGHNDEAQTAISEARRLSRDFSAAQRAVDGISAQQNNPARSPAGAR